MTRPTLRYFEMRGRAEAIRLLLHATGTAFDDHRVVTADAWAALVPDLPFGVLPTYETAGHRLGESHAILRHLGRTLVPVPGDETKRAEIDAAHDAIAESQEDLWRFNWRAGYYDELESHARERLVPRLERIEAHVARCADGGDWIGPVFSHVDCVAFCFLDELDAFLPAVLDRFPGLSALWRRVASREGIAAYLQSSARPHVFGIGAMGPKVDPRAEIPPGYRFRTPWFDPMDLSGVLRHQRRLTTMPG